MTNSESKTDAGHLAAALRRERRRRQQTQAEAAHPFGISQPSYSRWETSLAMPDDSRLEDVALYLHTDLASIWGLVHRDTVEPAESLHRMVDELVALAARIADVVEALSPRGPACPDRGASTRRP